MEKQDCCCKFDIFNPEKILKDLKIDSILPLIECDWNTAMRSMPGKTPRFLTEKEYSRAFDLCDLDREIYPLIKKNADIIVSDRSLLCYAWYLYWRLYISDQRLSAEDGRKIPELENKMGEYSGAFHILIVLGMVPFLYSYHKSLNLPEEITKENLSMIKCLLDEYALPSGGKAGIFGRKLHWIQNYLHGNIFFKIGRFEYAAIPYQKNWVSVYRNKKSHKVMALASSENFFTKDGLCDAPSNRNMETDYWKSEYKVTKDSVSGNPVSPDGRLLRKITTLPLEEWECVMDRDSIVLAIHIPPGGSMSIEACADSLKRATQFFKEYFPHLSPVAITCHSWIHSPNLTEFMPENSNLVRFSKECYLYPMESPKMAGLGSFFQQEKFDPLTAPRKTSLQRAIAEHLESGKDLRVGGMFILTDDVKHFGEQYYLTNVGV